MKVTKVTIAATMLANQVSDTAAPALSLADCHRLPIVEISPSGRVDIIDGYHRVAGMIAAGETTIDCLTCDDDGVLGDAANAEHLDLQAAALDAIYSAAE